MRRETYARGIAARLLPAAVVAAVAVLRWWVEDGQAALFAGLATLAACALIPGGSRR